MTCDSMVVVSSAVQKLITETTSIQEKIEQRSLEINNLYKNIQEAREKQFLFWEKFNDKLKYLLAISEPSITHRILFLSAEKAIDKLKKRYVATQLWYQEEISPSKTLSIIPKIKEISYSDSFQKTLDAIEITKNGILANLKMLLDQYKKLDLLAHTLVKEYTEDSNLLLVCKIAEDFFIKHFEKASTHSY